MGTPPPEVTYKSYTNKCTNFHLHNMFISIIEFFWEKHFQRKGAQFIVACGEAQIQNGCHSEWSGN